MKYVKIEREGDKVQATLGDNYTGYGSTVSEALSMLSKKVGQTELDYDECEFAYILLRPDDSLYACFEDFEGALQTKLSANDGNQCRIVGQCIFGEMGVNLHVVVDSEEHPIKCFGNDEKAKEWLWSQDDSEDYEIVLRSYLSEPHDRDYIG